MGPRAGLDGRKISSPRDSIPDRPVCSQSLYRLSYPAHTSHIMMMILIIVTMTLYFITKLTIPASPTIDGMAILQAVGSRCNGYLNFDLKY